MGSSIIIYGHTFWGLGVRRLLVGTPPLHVYQDRSLSRSAVLPSAHPLLDSLSLSHQSLPTCSIGLRTSQRTKQGTKMPPHLVKIKLDGDLRIMEIPTPPSFDGLVKAVAEAYAVPSGNEKRFSFTYKDSDGDEVSHLRGCLQGMPVYPKAWVKYAG